LQQLGELANQLKAAAKDCKIELEPHGSKFSFTIFSIENPFTRTATLKGLVPYAWELF